MQTNKLFVRNIPFSTSDGDLAQLFSTVGDVLSARVAMDRDSGRPRGFAFVEMETAEAAQAAIGSLNEREYEGRMLFVSISDDQKRKSRLEYR